MEEKTLRTPRVAALVGPSMTGKTSLMEALLLASGAIPKKGSAKDHGTVGDLATDAKARGVGRRRLGGLGVLGERRPEAFSRKGAEGGEEIEPQRATEVHRGQPFQRKGRKGRERNASAGGGGTQYSMTHIRCPFSSEGATTKHAKRTKRGGDMTHRPWTYRPLEGHTRPVKKNPVLVALGKNVRELRQDFCV